MATASTGRPVHLLERSRELGASDDFTRSPYVASLNRGE
jgi:hypothetical protein